jgi:hypothetical protein
VLPVVGNNNNRGFTSILKVDHEGGPRSAHRVWNPFCFCADEPELGAYETGDWCHRMAHVQRDHPVRLTILALSRLAHRGSSKVVGCTTRHHLYDA